MTIWQALVETLKLFGFMIGIVAAAAAVVAIVTWLPAPYDIIFCAVGFFIFMWGMMWSVGQDP